MRISFSSTLWWKDRPMFDDPVIESWCRGGEVSKRVCYKKHCIDPEEVT